MQDVAIQSVDRILRTLSGAVRAARPNPGDLRPAATVVDQADSVGSGGANGDLGDPAVSMTDAERLRSIALMRVNHAGEVAAQALYQGQALFSRDPKVRAKLEHAANEELDHLAWTRERVHELGGRTSVLDPLWYAGAFTLGAAAAAVGDKSSLAFLEATEEQVEAHLDSHLSELPANDAKSRAIVKQMKADEASHAQTARELGSPGMPRPVQGLMRAASKVMTSLAAKI
ncbi:MAG: 2-polyprenyl-3-methyl-6-methoxy-1,4-benzoquinone monooxygenase [Burkholderiales bacterium]|nr:MAG: 2-polyprenyl-3-methyl-6-methoxy-1,4-benzoquinone monooxygenase [Burkholderiales bacterium]TAG78568.1 MAG: 2-polyprenyl-3-methyl-6-methoxy-1,4-benzoquinone monooxygenase [Betaproteobacteria bacterium]